MLSFGSVFDSYRLLFLLVEVTGQPLDSPSWICPELEPISPPLLSTFDRVSWSGDLKHLSDSLSCSESQLTEWEPGKSPVGDSYFASSDYDNWLGSDVLHDPYTNSAGRLNPFTKTSFPPPSSYPYQESLQQSSGIDISSVSPPRVTFNSPMRHDPFRKSSVRSKKYLKHGSFTDQDYSLAQAYPFTVPKRRRTQRMHPKNKENSPKSPPYADRLFQYDGQTPNSAFPLYVSHKVKGEWRDFGSDCLLEERIIKHGGIQIVANRGPSSIPDPVWPSLTSLAKSYNNVITLRPFSFWNSWDRFQFFQLNKCSPDDLEAISYAMDSFNRKLQGNPRKALLAHRCQTLPIAYGLFPRRKGFESVPAFLKFLQPKKPKKTGHFRSTKEKVEHFFILALFYHSILFEREVGFPPSREAKFKFLGWLDRELYSPKNSLLVVGPIDKLLPDLNSHRFGDLQKIFIFVATSDHITDILDVATLSILKFWYKDIIKKTDWTKDLDGEFWGKILDGVLNSNHEAPPLQISYWADPTSERISDELVPEENKVKRRRRLVKLSDRKTRGTVKDILFEDKQTNFT
ncbi:hypothetical protein O181_048272 [Austropuccinia psidii MF-1]|uniref:Uncharacterized protein n=1 Tax=Austropuccinia psidii MF-1 TaxID=1389203 RepID=A0A9Q3HLG6_9BASI|nr:hypothetical protein [Austropuccinia psidii MF-1]